MPHLDRILVLASEPMIAALVGALVEIAGRNPVFAEAGEAPTDAIVRLRPLAVVLVDARLGAASSDIFFAVAGRHRIGSAVFGSERDARSIAETAAARAIPWFTLPPTADELAAAIGIAAGEPTEARSVERRSNIDATVAADGTRILRDSGGHRWMIYDRRSANDRRLGTASPHDTTTRVFVSDVGERRECSLHAAEVAETSAADLEEQLTRAT